MRHVAHGVLRAHEGLSLAERLVILEQGLNTVIEAHRPAVGSVETLFFHKDPQAAAKLGHARGVVLLCLQRVGVSVVEYSPALVKASLTGSGRAQKAQVAQMIKMLLCLEEVPASDAADALALAVTHLRRAPIDRRLAERAAANPAMARALQGRRSRGGARLRPAVRIDPK
jgi:crossover junction endodeoxyribonuclease RuvC